jgi:hypothetical protein
VALLSRVEVWSALACQSGSRLAVVREPLVVEGKESLTGDDRVTVEMPATDQAVSSLLNRRVIRLVFSDGDFTEWRIQDDGREQTEGGKVTVVAVSPLFDLADATVIREIESGGVVNFDVGVNQATVTEVLDDIILPALADVPNNEYAYFARGTIDPTGLYDVVVDGGTPLAWLRFLCDAARDPVTKRPAELRVRRNGTTGYYIDVLTEINGDADIPDLRAKKNLRRTSYSRSSQQQATVVYPKGAADADGVRRGVERAVWTLTLSSGTTYQITDPEGGPSPVLEDDQLNGFYVVPDGTNPLIQITDTAAGTPATVTLASSSGITSGLQYELREDASNTLVTSVKSPTAIATYGTKVGTVDRPDLVGIRNLLRDPWFRGWSGDSLTIWSEAEGAAGVTRNTDPLFFQYGDSSAKCVTTGTPIRLNSATFYPRAVVGAQLFSCKLRVLFATFTGDTQFSVYVTNATTNAPYATYTVVPPDYPFPGPPRMAVGEWVEIKIQGIDLGAANAGGARVVIRCDCSAGASQTTYIDAVQVEQQSVPSEVWVEYSGANALWHAGNLALSLNKDPVATYEVELDDLERAGETTFDDLLIGSYARLNESALGISNTLVRIVEKPRINWLVPKDTTITLATKTKLLADFLAAVPSGGAATVTGSGSGSGTGPPPTTTPPGSGPPPPPTAVAAAPTRWEIRAQTGSVCLIVDVPSAATEVDTKLRRYVQIGEKHNLTGRVVTAGNSGSYLAVQYFRTSDSTWRYLDGTSGPQLSLTSTGDILGTLVTTEADARGWQLCRLVSAAGDAAADPEFGSLALVGAVAASTSTPPVDIPTDLADLFDALFLSDVDIYSDTALTTPQTTNGNRVLGWRNRVSGATVHGLQSNSSFAPKLNTGTTLNGYQSLEWVGGVTGYSLLFSDLLDGTTEATVFLVLQKTGATSDGNLWNFGGNVGNVTNYGDPDGIIHDSALSTVRINSADPTPSLTAPHIYAVRSRDNDWQNYVSSLTALFTTGTNTYKAGQSGDCTLGINGTGDGFSGYVWMLGMVARYCTDDEITERMEALADRYAITLV